MDAFERDKAAMIVRIDAATAKLANIEKLLFQCQSCTAVDIRDREAQKAQQVVAALIEREVAALLASAQAACTQSTAANTECAPPRCVL